MKDYSLPKWPANVEKTELKQEGRNPKNKKRYSVEFEVIKEELTLLLGAKASQHIGLLELYPENFVRSNATNTVKANVQLIKEYDDVFEGDIGTLSGIQRLEVDPSISPTMSPPRRVSFALKSALKS